MIARKNRFHGHGSIRRLYAGGKSVRCGAFSLRYAPNLKRQEYRMAVVVSRKVSKSAVVRNRIRRRIYEYVRILYANFSGVYDLAITVFDEKVATMSSNELEAELNKLFTKAGLTSVPKSSHDIVES